MARPRTARYWHEKIIGYTVNGEGRGPTRVEKLLLEDAGREERTDVPSITTIARIQRAARALSERERDNYRFVYWPEVCEGGRLPWEASRAILEMLRYLAAHGGGRPPLSLARAFWRVSLARPNASPDLRLSAAVQLASSEVVRHPQNARRLEEFLSRETVDEPMDVILAAPEGALAEATWAAINAATLQDRKPATFRRQPRMVEAPDWDYLFGSKGDDE